MKEDKNLNIKNMQNKNFIEEEIQGYHWITTFIREDILIKNESKFRNKNVTIHHLTIFTDK